MSYVQEDEYERREGPQIQKERWGGENGRSATAEQQEVLKEAPRRIMMKTRQSHLFRHDHQIR